MLPSGGHDDLFDGLVCFLALGRSHEGLLSLPEDLLVNSLDEPIFVLFDSPDLFIVAVPYVLDSGNGFTLVLLNLMSIG